MSRNKDIQTRTEWDLRIRTSHAPNDPFPDTGNANVISGVRDLAPVAQDPRAVILNYRGKMLWPENFFTDADPRKLSCLFERLAQPINNRSNTSIQGQPVCLSFTIDPTEEQQELRNFHTISSLYGKSVTLSDQRFKHVSLRPVVTFNPEQRNVRDLRRQFIEACFKNGRDNPIDIVVAPELDSKNLQFARDFLEISVRPDIDITCRIVSNAQFGVYARQQAEAQLELFKV